MQPLCQKILKSELVDFNVFLLVTNHWIFDRTLSGRNDLNVRQSYFIKLDEAFVWKLEIDFENYQFCMSMHPSSQFCAVNYSAQAFILREPFGCGCLTFQLQVCKIQTNSFSKTHLENLFSHPSIFKINSEECPNVCTSTKHFDNTNDSNSPKKMWCSAKAFYWNLWAARNRSLCNCIAN